MIELIINTVGLMLSFLLGAWVASRSRAGMSIIPTTPPRKPKETDVQRRNPRENIKL